MNRGRVRLGVNVDHVATVRQARRGRVPDLLDLARQCERAGADSIVCHLREDRRHIQDADVRQLKAKLRVPLNLEMSIAQDIVKVALSVRPAQVTLVPERRQELTTEGGLDVTRLERRVRRVIEQFRRRDVDVSLFIDPERAQLDAAADVGAQIIELHTGVYADARGEPARRRARASLARAAAYGHGLGLRVAAGHGLDYQNVAPIARIPEIEELNIGFSIVSRALTCGMTRAVAEMRARMMARRGR